MNQAAALLITADNYAVGKVSTFGDDNHILGFYQISYGRNIRIKIHVGDGHFQAMNPEEMHQFPENYEFRIPFSFVRHNRGFHTPRSF